MKLSEKITKHCDEIVKECIFSVNIDVPKKPIRPTKPHRNDIIYTEDIESGEYLKAAIENLAIKAMVPLEEVYNNAIIDFRSSYDDTIYAMVSFEQKESDESFNVRLEIYNKSLKEFKMDKINYDDWMKKNRPFIIESKERKKREKIENKIQKERERLLKENNKIQKELEKLEKVSLT